MLKKFPVVWYRVIIVSALSLSEIKKEKREIELDKKTNDYLQNSQLIVFKCAHIVWIITVKKFLLQN